MDRARSRNASSQRIRKTVSRPRARPELVEGLAPKYGASAARSCRADTPVRCLPVRCLRDKWQPRPSELSSCIRVVILSEGMSSRSEGIPQSKDPCPAKHFLSGTTSLWAAQGFSQCVSTQIGIVIPTSGRDLQHKRLSFRPTGGICSCFWAAQGLSPAVNLLWNSGF